MDYAVTIFAVQLFPVSFLTCLSTLSTAKSELYLGSGVPLPHADELEKMIKTYMFPKKKDNETFMEYFEDRDMDIDNNTMKLLENLDFSVLDTDGVRNVLNLMLRQEKEKKSTLRKPEPKRRALYADAAALWDMKAVEVINKTFDLMTQSIYSTRYAIETTKPIRKMYRSEFVYQMGIMYGYLLELRFKAENCLATMNKFNDANFKFSRYLFLYERLLTIHMDFTTSLQRMFMLQAEIHKPTTPVITSTVSSEESA